MGAAQAHTRKGGDATGERRRHLAVGVLFGAAAALVALAALSGAASASSYGGSGNWTIPAAANEVDTGETIAVTGNLTVAGTLSLVNTTLTIDRNATVTGSLILRNSSLTFTLDGPGTNYITAGPLAFVGIYDGDNNSATTGDRSRLIADAYGFNGTFADSAELRIWNSFVQGAGWSSGGTQRPGFALQNGWISITGSQFEGGFETIAAIQNVTVGRACNVTNSSFNGMASALNFTGGFDQQFRGLRFSNTTFGLRLNGSQNVFVDGVVASSPLIQPYDAPFAPPPGTAVAAEGVQGLSARNITLMGTPGAPAPRFLNGLVVANASGVDVRALTGAWGDTPAQFFQSSNILVIGVNIANFSAPLSFLASTNVTVLDFHGAGEASGLQVGSTSGLTVRGFTASELFTYALSSLGASGAFDFEDASITDGIGAVNLGGNATAPRFVNITMVNLTFGLQLAVADPTGARFEGLEAKAVLQNLIDLTFANASAVTVINLTADGVGGLVANFTGTAASRFSFQRATLNNTTSDVLRLNVTSIDNLTVAGVTSNLHLGALVRISANLTTEVTLTDIVSSNSSGIVAVIEGGTIDRVRAVNITLTAGDQPPAAGPPATIVLDSTGQGGRPLASVTSASVSYLRANVSNRGGVFVQAGQGGSLSVDHVSLVSLQLDGVRVIAGTGAFSVTVDTLSYNGTGAAAVRLEGISSATVTGVVATAGTAVQLDASFHVSVHNVTHDGDYAGIAVTGGGDIAADAVDARGTFAVDATLFDGLRLTNITARSSGWAVRATSGSNVTVDGLGATATANGVAFLGIVGAALSNAALEIRGDGFVVGQGSSDIQASGLLFTTPTGATADTALQISYSNRVRVVSLNFTGRCEQAVMLQTANYVDLLGFQAASCGRGLDASVVRFLNITAFTAVGAFNGSALKVASSQAVMIDGVDVHGAAGDGVQVSGLDRAQFLHINASGAGGDGALFAFVSNTTVDGLVLDGAAGVCMRVLSASRNVTVTHISASRGLGGIEVLSSPNLTVSDVVASGNGGIGVYGDLLSPGLLMRNITAASNLWNGVLVLLNGTRLIDGNFSDNGAAGISAAPSVRLDWRVEGTATLTDETIELTGDLTLAPGASLTVTRSNVTVEQTARRKALDPYAKILLGDGAALTFDHVVLAPRDARTPYSIEARQGARLVLRAATVSGGGTGDATSSANFTGADVVAVDATFGGWNAPLSLTGGSLDCNACTFAHNRRGPTLVGADAWLSTFYSRDNDLDGLDIRSTVQVRVDGASVQYNHGVGAHFEAVRDLVLTRVEALANDLGGVEVMTSNLTATGLWTNSSGGTGLYLGGGALASIDGFAASFNAGSGAEIEDMGEVHLADIRAERNHVSGLRLVRVATATIDGGTISGSTLYGLWVQESGATAAEGLDFAGDEGGAVRTEGAASVALGNATVTSAADYTITLFGSSQARLTNLIVSGGVAGLLAAQTSFALVVNSTMTDPTVLDDAVVVVAWHLRVLVEGAGGYPAAGTQVTVDNLAGTRDANSSTGAGGATPLLVVREREVRSNGAEVLFGPFTVRALHPQLGRNVAVVNVTHFTSMLVQLDNGTPMTNISMAGVEGLGGWYRSLVEVTLRAADDRRAGVLLHWRVGGTGPWHEPVEGSDAASVTLSFPTEGATTLEFFAADAAGNEEPVHTVTVRVDLHPPIAHFEAVNATVYDPLVTLAWGAADGDGSGAVAFQVNYSVHGSPLIAWQNMTDATSAVFRTQDATYEFRLWAFDASGWGSAPVNISFRAALSGSVRVRVVDLAGNFVANVTLEVSGLSGPVRGEGIVVAPGVPPGSATVRVSAPGFAPRTLEVLVNAGETTDVGTVTLERDGSAGGGFDLTAAYLVLAGLGLLAVAYYIQMRHKWERKAKAREAQAEADRKAEKARRRRR